MLYIYLSSVVQVVAESFPISSSGHCALLESLWERALSLNPLLQLPAPWTGGLFFERFIDVLHIIPLAIIAIYFYKRWRIFFMHPLRMWRMAAKLIFYVALADAVTGVFYLVRDWPIFASIPLWVGFGFTSLSLFLLSMVPEKNGRLNSMRAIVLGIFQGVALVVPGLSRFATTFLGARLIGFSSRHALEVSFMVQWPLMLAAAARSVLFFVHKSHGVLMMPMLWLVIGCSAIVAWYGFAVSVRLALSGRLWLFGVYTVFIMIVTAVLAY
jgi:undecaprenyl pyrophosphate phosphatase UppP